jgi:hypothetical protein
MAPFAFAPPSFLGARLTPASKATAASPTCMAMQSDSLAPEISITGNGRPGTSSSVSVSMRPVAPNLSVSAGVAATAGLKSMLRASGRARPSDAAPLRPVPSGVAAADFYFPPGAARNVAPVVSLSAGGVSVSFDKIEKSVAGVSSNAGGSVAFWKKPTYKFSAPETSAADQAEPEIIVTSKFEKYFPTATRNLAPAMSFRAPSYPGDSSGYLIVDSTRVSLNSAMVAEVEKVTNEYRVVE